MAVAVQMDFEGATLEQYDAVLEEMGFDRNGAGEEGGLFHWVAPTDTGIRIVDVWRSREIFDRFGQERLGPVTAALGIAPPTMTFFDVHNWLTAP